MLKRANLILEAVKSAKLIDNLFLLQKRIVEEETKEGYHFRIDKKSMVRLIERLDRGKQLRSLRNTIDLGGGETKSVSWHYSVSAFNNEYLVEQKRQVYHTRTPSTIEHIGYGNT